jgi:hypothetical protein
VADVSHFSHPVLLSETTCATRKAVIPLLLSSFDSPGHALLAPQARLAYQDLTTMAVAAATRPVHNGLAGPRSPTLSDAGMILPEAHVRSLSPNLHTERPPSPPVLYTHTNPSHVKLALAPQNRRRASQQSKSPALSAQSSRSTLRTMGDSGVPTKHALTRDDPLASSPTIQNGLKSNSPKNWTPQAQRRASDASSMLSEDFENWPGFDSHDAFDDSGLGLEEQEKRDHFPGDEQHNNDMNGDRWLSQHSSGSDEDDDPYSSAALSRRAEIILANAKKRLNVCVTVSWKMIGRVLTIAGHGRKPPRCSRITRRVSNL